PTPGIAPPPAGEGLPALAGGSPELDELSAKLQPEVAFVAIFAALATVFFGIVPQPLFDLVHHAGSALGGLFF
ncbi:MAG: hypothetical protein ACYDHT_09960, partial [Solirubrobacteraceae bacterium]